MKDRKIAEIAAALGFAEPSAFTQALQGLVGRDPRPLAGASAPTTALR